ncbi:hypothetical protein ACFV14_18080 [Streptomyces zaomyceticus]
MSGSEVAGPEVAGSEVTGPEVAGPVASLRPVVAGLRPLAAEVVA